MQRLNVQFDLSESIAHDDDNIDNFRNAGLTLRLLQ